ncbi:MAG: dienelactone hydrolase family protein [Pseudomonadota bacterium]|nr:dienelactone hydrolase family protein [Pseudomonadota bacterium]
MSHESLTIRTADGDCPSFCFTSKEGSGPRPVIVVYMDAGGIRSAMMEMAQRLADAGYVVLLPDLFYRYGPYGPFVPREVFAGDFRTVLGPLMATTDNLKAAVDTEALLEYLNSRDDVAGSKVGAVGFCMGGGMAIAAAGTWPDRFCAVASFHGGRLATDEPTSPHLFAPRLSAEIYVAAAENDSSYPPEMAASFEAALDSAGVRYSAETYPAAHGWMMPDFPVYDHGEAERGWTELLRFFARSLE